MKQNLNGSCLCGKISYECEAEPKVQVACHCTDCQKQTGSSYSTIIGVPAESLKINGETRVFTHKGSSGGLVRRNFCGDCGSPVFTEPDQSPGMLWIKTGTLDNPQAFQPQMHVWCQSRNDWLELGDVPSFETMPG